MLYLILHSFIQLYPRRICCKTNEAVATAAPVADPEVVKAADDEANTEVSEAVEADGTVTEEAAEKEAEEKGYKCCGIY